jgi:hypothetical protein
MYAFREIQDGRQVPEVKIYYLKSTFVYILGIVVGGDKGVKMCSHYR